MVIKRHIMKESTLDVKNILNNYVNAVVTAVTLVNIKTNEEADSNDDNLTNYNSPCL